VDFYAYQATARRQSRVFVLLFIVALACVVLALDAVLFTVLDARDGARYASYGYGESQQYASPGVGPLDYARRHPDTALGISLLILGVIGIASAFKSLELRAGGAVVARSVGGVRVDPDTSDPALRRLRNIIEEMAVAASVPVPEVYVLEQEPAINAFAAGQTPANAAITVTRGALDQLTRDELQGVIGHEFSHIVNGDMRLNVQLMGAIFGLLVIAVIGRMMFYFAPRGGDRDRRGGGMGWVGVGLAVMALGYIGLMAGRILQAAVSRQRERLADGSAVQFTRNTDGLKGALMKIAASEYGSRFVAADAEQVAHMLFAPGLDRIFATHPPLLERIRELDPHFDPAELERLAARSATVAPGGNGPAAATAGGAATGTASAFAGAGGTVQAAAAAATVGAASAGTPGSPAYARALVLALLASRDPAVRQAQGQLLSRRLGPAEFEAINAAGAQAGNLPPMQRLPMLLTLFPSLRRLPRVERQQLAQLAQDLIHLHAGIEVFEFCLGQLLGMLLTDEMTAQPPHGTLTLEQAAPSVHALFATLARCGSSDEQEINAAYDAGIRGVLARPVPYATYDDWPQRTSDALGRLGQLRPQEKQKLIDGLVRTVAADGRLAVEEDELLRTTCALLHCPMPQLGAG